MVGPTAAVCHSLPQSLPNVLPRQVLRDRDLAVAELADVHVNVGSVALRHTRQDLTLPYLTLNLPCLATLRAGRCETDMI